MKGSNILITILIISTFGLFMYGTVAQEWFGPNGWNQSVPKTAIDNARAFNSSSNLAVMVRDSTPGGPESKIDPEDNAGQVTSALTLLDVGPLLLQIPAIVKELINGVYEQTGIPPIFFGLLFVIFVIITARAVASLFGNSST